MKEDPNSFEEQEQPDAPEANPEPAPEGTDVPTPADAPSIDYKTKFTESQKEALRLREREKELEAEIAALKDAPEPVAPDVTDPSVEAELFPGFDRLDPEAQRNLIAYTNTVTNRAKEGILKDPAIAFARSSYNEKKWDDAVASVMPRFPDLKEHLADFKTKYFNPQNVPDNVETLIEDLAKIYLFDQAKELGAEEERERTSRVDLEEIGGGPKESQPTRTLDDWNRMARENPQKFASLSKEFNEDLASGRI